MLSTGPGAPENVSATATYDLDSNGVLSNLMLSWDEVVCVYRRYICVHIRVVSVEVNLEHHNMKTCTYQLHLYGLYMYMDVKMFKTSRATTNTTESCTCSRPTYC